MPFLKLSAKSRRLSTKAAAMNIDVNEKGANMKAVTVIAAMQARYMKVFTLRDIFLPPVKKGRGYGPV